MAKNVRTRPSKAGPSKARGAVGGARKALSTQVRSTKAPAKTSKPKSVAPAVAKPTKATSTRTNGKATPVRKPGPTTSAATRKASLPRVARSSITAPEPSTVVGERPFKGAASPVAVRNGKGSPSQSAAKSMSKSRTPSTLALPDGYRPSDAEPFMGAMHKAYFRKKLMTWKDEIIRETMETLQVLHDDTAQHPDLADRAASEAERALDLRARDRQRKLIAKIDAALKRIEDGSYGYCMETGEPIGLRRLEARPIATLSLEAQERHERRERVYRDD